MSADARWMRMALTLARRGLGRVWPNPAVGCVLVKDGRVIGRGWTQPGGRPHAETMALAIAGAQARGATAYVTLEPCAHHGRTPPCADALIAAGITRLVAPLEDPDPRVAGRGFARLRAAGVEVSLGEMRAEAEAANRGFLTRQRAGRPMLTLKLAATLDGRIATAAGESRWITGPAARAKVHLLRAEADAVLVGAGTARADDPELTVRAPGLTARRPVRIVADPRLSVAATSRLAQSAASAGPVWLCHTPGAAGPTYPTGVEKVETAAGADGLSPKALLAALGARGLTRVFCEGGGRFAAALLNADLVDELILISAGAAIGAEGAAAIGPMAVERLAAAPRFDLIRQQRLGEDLMSLWRPQRQNRD